MQESRPNFGPKGQIGWQDFDRYLSLEAAVGGAVNDPHATAPDLALELEGWSEDARDSMRQLGVGG
jgi:hypothetical protein